MQRRRTGPCRARAELTPAVFSSRARAITGSSLGTSDAVTVATRRGKDVKKWPNEGGKEEAAATAATAAPPYLPHYHLLNEETK